MIQADIVELIRPTIESMSYTLWGCQYLPRGNHALLRIYIDHPNGVGVADCERVSRQVSAVLDVEDPIVGEYLLEVSSPGIPRPLFYPDQYQRYIGHAIEINLRKPIGQQRRFSGILRAANAQEIALDLGQEMQNFSFNMIAKAYLTSE